MRLTGDPMKKIAAICLAISGAFSSSVIALECAPTTKRGSNSPGVFLGITYAFGSKEGLGLTLQATSSRHDDRGIVAAGLSYYPATGSIGIPLSLGYQKNDALVSGGYDFLLKAPVAHVGYTSTSKDKTTCEILEPSDIRLKHDIHELAVLESGLKIYSFKYKSREGDFVGVMAQELLANPTWSNAVVQREDGHYLVNYGALGIRMTTLENWNQNGTSSVLRNEVGTRS
jgi:hypothetical protein